MGNRTSEVACWGGASCTPITTTYAYDDANRLTSVNGQPYTWDANGNLLSDGTFTYTYNAANRLITATNGITVSGYSYNGLGDRVNQSVAGVVTTYTLDLAAGLAQVLADGTYTYLYGNGRIAQYDGGDFEYFLGDALGSVRQLADENGEVTLARRYEPYGKVLESVGTGTTNYGFAAENFDAVTGLIYLRARFMQPYLNQFIQPDPMVPQFDDPRTLHRYVYANNSPVNFTDPSGYCWGSDTWHPSDQDECWDMVRRVEESLGGAANEKLQQMNTAWRWKAKWDTPQLKRLLYLINNHSGRPNLVLGDAFTVNGEERLWLVSAFGRLVSIQNLTGSATAVEALARWIEFSVALQQQQGGVNKGIVMNDLLLVENGFVKNRWGIPQYAPAAQSLGVRQFNDSGFHPAYRDGDDQVHHTTFFMALASDAPFGLPLGGCINLYHETIDPNALAGKSLADYRLGQRALQLGAALAVAPVGHWGHLTRFMLRTADFTVLYPSPGPNPY